MYYSKNSELKITLLFVNIIVNTECQNSQNNAAELYPYFSRRSRGNSTPHSLSMA